MDHYVQAAGLHAGRPQEAGAILGGRLPHTVAYEFGGVTTTPDAEHGTRFRTLLNQVMAFIDAVYVPDVDFLAAKLPGVLQHRPWLWQPARLRRL